MILKAKDIIGKTAGLLRFDSADCSFSPFDSSVGLLADEKQNGLLSLVLHYNRVSRAIFETTVDFPHPLNRSASDISKLVFGKNDLVVSFFGRNAFYAECKTYDTVFLCNSPSDGVSFWIESISAGDIILRGYSETTETRDPDRKVPFALLIHAIDGSLSSEHGRISAKPKNDVIRLSFVFRCLEIDVREMQTRSASAPADVLDCVSLCRDWVHNRCRDLKLTIRDESQTDKICIAIAGLIYNLTMAEGKLRRHLSAFPSRGTYPTHFLWDTCFENLAYELMDFDTAKDLLLQNIENQRSDGKFAQFLCSTWERPFDSQPALIGWAGLRLMKRRFDPVFAAKLLDALNKNNAWWLTHRRTDTGLIYTLGGLETGQDNSPRFDNGPTIAADMNAYLLNQLYAAAAVSSMLKHNDADILLAQAKDFEMILWKTLYDPDDRIFYDLDLNNRNRIRIISPSGLLPFWASACDTHMKVSEAKKSIDKYLLSQLYLFGPVPFPSVAYSESSYRHDDWWRGPTWMPIAYLMLELLLKFGYIDELQSGARRLYSLIAADDRLSELYDSKTGKGLGAAQQGWTCAVFIKLIDFLNGGKNGLL